MIVFTAIYLHSNKRRKHGQIFQSRDLKNPPALSKNGKCNLGTRQSSLNVLKNQQQQLHLQDYSSEVFCLEVKNHRQDYSAERIDVVFDAYKHESLKAATRCKQRKGGRRKVKHDNVVPSNW